jgi:hypothetical protein
LRVAVSGERTAGQGIGDRNDRMRTMSRRGLRFSSSGARCASASDADFQWFTRMVYDHTTEMPLLAKATGQPLRPRFVMGNYNRATVQESSLRQIYDWMRTDLGVRANIVGRISPAVPGRTALRTQ